MQETKTESHGEWGLLILLDVTILNYIKTEREGAGTININVPHIHVAFKINTGALCNKN